MGLGRIEKEEMNSRINSFECVLIERKRGIYSAAHVDKQTQETRE